MTAKHLLSMLLVLLLVCSSSGDNPKPSSFQEKEESPRFLSDLEFVLKQGARAKDEHAVSACVALLFSEDPELIELTIQVARTFPEQIGPEMFESALSKLSRGQLEKDSEVAAKRMVELMSLAEKMQDGHAYLQLVTRHLDSTRQGIRLEASSALGKAYPYLEAVSDKRTPVPKPPDGWMAPESLRPIQLMWIGWLESADKKRLNVAMKKFFSQQRRELYDEIRRHGATSRKVLILQIHTKPVPKGTVPYQRYQRGHSDL